MSRMVTLISLCLPSHFHIYLKEGYCKIDPRWPCEHGTPAQPKLWFSIYVSSLTPEDHPHEASSASHWITQLSLIHLAVRSWCLCLGIHSRIARVRWHSHQMLHFMENLLSDPDCWVFAPLSPSFGKHLILIIFIIPLNSQFIVQFMMLFIF